MKIATLGLLAIIGASFAGTATAGVNANGYLLLHTDDSVIYTEDDEDSYCNLLEVDCPFDPECDDDHMGCSSAAMSLTPTSGLGPDETLVWVVAAFWPDACPRVTAVQFGLSWPVEAAASPIIKTGSCAPFELPTGNWPNELLEGTAVSWAPNAITRTAFPVYWFTAYSYYGPMEVALADFPTGTTGAAFADDSVPAVLDQIPDANMGSVGLNGATGSNPYMVPVPVNEKSWGEVKAIFGR
ncbi:MAG: hypothetical protein KDA27_25770 [Candidatus Eisenbacteria bacterium]|uniref:Uncharacterized protein n=1 Tax=Eiseniibacteriota bacterium TaxID=2212470 RepID=A0A956SH28_UNCEI|nr:hypothetical protein [Candidatus Eisenbacteria bacterium]MCB9463153.1 hypothetical protein [Candidatus Eisenbacteria bacterium]